MGACPDRLLSKIDRWDELQTVNEILSRGLKMNKISQEIISVDSDKEYKRLHNKNANIYHEIECIINKTHSISNKEKNEFKASILKHHTLALASPDTDEPEEYVEGR